MRKAATELFLTTQSNICEALERADGAASFVLDEWKRNPDGTGGGGKTRVLARGKIFEKAGVNFSEVEGELPAFMVQKLIGESKIAPFFATGVSLVIHPLSPFVPTTHANFRYLEVEGKRWFGGGMDLTPYYLFEEDASHFHHTLKTACDNHDISYYPKFKKWCDEYFYLPHRKETRGVGGIFFDYIGRDEAVDLNAVFAWVKELCASFVPAYVPIVEKRKTLQWTPEQKEFQLLRRGRYVEFNLLYDRGTQFGLSTNGRTESILMSLPPEVRWEYNFSPEPGTHEAKLLEVLTKPREWVG